MSNILTHKNNFLIAESIKHGLSQSTDTKYYIGIGRLSVWTSNAVSNNVQSEYDVWNNLLAAKRIVASDVNFVVPRINWASATSFQVFDQTKTDLHNADSYCLTSNGHVYVCLSNNTSGATGANSDFEPNTVGTGTIDTGDGYLWKYMYSIDPLSSLKFLTTDYMPVLTNSAVQAAAVAGAIEHVEVLTTGSYGTNGTYNLSVSGDGTGFSANVTIADNIVSGVTILSKGSGYHNTVFSISNYSGVTTTAATFLPVLSVGDGLGYYPPKDFQSNYLLFNCKLREDETEKFYLDNKYHMTSIITNPNEEASGLTALGNAYRQTTRLWLSKTEVDSAFVANETIVQNTTNTVATVVQYDTTSNSTYGLLSVTNSNADFDTSANSILTGSSTGNFWGTIYLSESPELEKYSGDVLYIDKHAGILRSAFQNEDIKLVIKY